MKSTFTKTGFLCLLLTVCSCASDKGDMRSDVGKGAGAADVKTTEVTPTLEEPYCQVVEKEQKRYYAIEHGPYVYVAEVKVKTKDVVPGSKNVLPAEPRTEPATAGPVIAEPVKTDKLFDLTFGIFGNKMYSGGDYMPGGHANYSTDFYPGFNLAGEFYINNVSSVYSRLVVSGTPLSGTFNNFTATQNSEVLYYWDLGYRYTFNDHFSLKGFFGLRQDYIFYVINTTSGALQKYWHGVIGTGCDYSFFKSGKFSLDGGTDFSIFLSTSTSMFQSKTGALLGTEIRPTFEYSYPFFAFFRFEYFKLNNSLFMNQSGKSLLVGVGWTFRVKPAGSL
jgi:hypothetical protein